MTEDTKPRAKPITGKPEDEFKDWAFDIGQHYWPIFGLTQNDFIDPELTEPKRKAYAEELINQGMDKKAARSKAVHKYAIYSKRWVRSHCLSLDDFQTGYCFKHKTEPQTAQILFIDIKEITLVLFNPKTKRYTDLLKTDFDGLCRFLKTGFKGDMSKVSPQELPESDMKYELKKHLMV